MSRSADELQRWLDLIVCLLAHRSPVTFETIQREVLGYQDGTKSAQKRTFERDKDELRKLGVPIETEGEEGDNESAYRLRAADFYMPYLAVASERGVKTPPRVDKDGYRSLAQLAFEPGELEAVATAAARVTQLGDDLLAEDAASAMRKLAFDLPMDAAGPDPDAMVVRARASAVPAILSQLNAALLARKRVNIEYHSLSSASVSWRMVEPYGLCFLSGHWYLVARGVDDDVVRNFRINRVLQAKPNTAQPATPDYDIPRTFRLRDRAQVREAWLLGDSEPVDAIVQFSAASGAARGATRLGAPIANAPLQRRFAVRRTDVFARWLLSFAGDAAPVSPDAVVGQFGALARATRGMYGDGTTLPSHHD